MFKRQVKGESKQRIKDASSYVLNCSHCNEFFLLDSMLNKGNDGVNSKNNH
ncbi:hypothetical protein BDD30_4367 [Photorhabdus asymbiotica]|uniref:Uncharacterized protein n=1 Tax=Photorhabdus asymbiotica TaxID=291112 RepID=A0ABX9SJA8_9GAMM|nr:hypothetical protein BDD30_4367 [Photorhabdus asymbiotica]